MGRTPRGQTRAKVLAFVRERLLAGTPPTVREVQRAMGFRSAQTAQQHLEALVADGRLVVQRGVSRGYRLAEDPVHAPHTTSAQVDTRADRHLSGSPSPAHRGSSSPESIASVTPDVMPLGALAALDRRRLVPLLGHVQAGSPSFASEDIEGYLALDPAGIVDADAPAHVSGEHFALRVLGDSMNGAGILPGDVVIVRRQDRARSGEIVVALIGDEATIKRLHLSTGRVELRAENPDFAPIVPEDGEVAILGRVVEVRRTY